MKPINIRNNHRSILIIIIENLGTTRLIGQEHIYQGVYWPLMYIDMFVFSLMSCVCVRTLMGFCEGSDGT